MNNTIIKIRFTLILLTFFITVNAQFAPPAGQAGSNAIYKDSSLFVAWASGCTVTRGLQDITDASLGYASIGDSTNAIGIADGVSVVSLGDGGTAVLTFQQSITNGTGYDFAVFENGFADNYLELAFVEVSSDGINYVRFPATSNTQDTIQIGGFGYLDATLLNNLAGKYRANYGTPFDLQELSGSANLNIDSITHIKIIDVVGSINPIYGAKDNHDHLINDPWTTPFASSGFDLDAVGVIHQLPACIAVNKMNENSISIYPNPATNSIYINTGFNSNLNATIIDITGNELQHFVINNTNINHNIDNLPKGLYLLRMYDNINVVTQQFIKQ